MKRLKLQLLFSFLLSLYPDCNAFALGFENQGEISVKRAEMPRLKDEDVSSTSGVLGAKLRLGYLFSKQTSFQIQPDFIYDSLAKSAEERNQFELLDLSLNWKKASRKLKIGYGTVSWEGTDFINPMDVLSAKNWIDPINPIQRGMLGIFYSDVIGSIFLDFVFIPNQTESRLPGAKSPWWPRHLQLPTQNENLQLMLPAQVNYTIESKEVIDQANKNNAAIRMQYHGEGVDLSFAATEAAATSPYLIPTLDVIPIQTYPREIYLLQSPVRLLPLIFRQRTFAVAGVYNYRTWILRLAAQNVQPLGVDPRRPSSSAYEVLSLEKTFEWGHSQSMTLLLQTSLSQQPTNSSVSLMSNLIDKSILLGCRWPFSEKWTWASALFQEQKHQSIFIHSDLNWSATERFSWTVAGDFFTGSDQSVIGIYEDNDRFSLQLKYSF